MSSCCCSGEVEPEKFGLQQVNSTSLGIKPSIGLFGSFWWSLGSLQNRAIWGGECGWVVGSTPRPLWTFSLTMGVIHRHPIPPTVLIHSLSTGWLGITGTYPQSYPHPVDKSPIFDVPRGTFLWITCSTWNISTAVHRLSTEWFSISTGWIGLSTGYPRGVCRAPM